MVNSFETNFVPQTVEKTPFVDMPAQNFFGEWCRINGSIIPEFIPREDWEQRSIQGILEKNDQGKQTLFLPEDLHLWEMMDIIRIVDHDTLVRHPEKRGERADKIKELGKIFEKAGIYLSQYLPTLEDTQGKLIAEDIAREFYQYGLSLQDKERKEDQIPESAELSVEDKTKLDEWFLGRDAYQKRLARLGENPTEKQIEEIRKKLFSVYFKALGREGYKADGEKPWETKVGPMQHLQDRARRQITKAVETPEREMKTAIFIRGMENLVTEMKEAGWRKAINALLKKVGFDPIFEQRRLYDTLQIDTLKQELEEVRKTGDIEQISAKELEIAKKIQRAVSSFPYGKNAGSYHPSKMVETQFINCVGSSILGGGLLEELKIKYLIAHLPEHSITVLITSDGKLRWQDLTPPGKIPWNYKEIKDEDITGKNKDNKPLTTEDIVEFAENPTDEGIRFEINSWRYDLNIGLFKPEIGLQCFILNNTVNALSHLGRKEEAIEAYRQGIDVDPKYADLYYGLGNVLYYLGRKEEAIEAYRQGIDVDPECAYLYNRLGNVLYDLGRKEEAIEAYRQGIDVDQKYVHLYYGLGNALSHLGRKEEAIEAYRQGIDVDPECAHLYYGLGNVLSHLGRKEEAIEAYRQFIKLYTGDKYWINRAKKIIETLQKEE